MTNLSADEGSAWHFRGWSSQINNRQCAATNLWKSHVLVHQVTVDMLMAKCVCIAIVQPQPP